jgi:hypothetical protein
MKHKFLLSFIILLLISITTFAEKPPSGKATGYFLSFGVGPRVPVGSFSNSTDIGYGLEVEFSYTDNEYLPVFLFGSIGFEQYPGSQNYLQETEYSNYHTNSFPVNLGARYYFPPLLENIVLLMPIVQASFNYTYFQKLHEFDESAGKDNYLEKKSGVGFTAGAGVSMFMMELMAAYNYTNVDQFLSFDLKVRIPLYISM